ncbi:FAD/FMN-containing dehydrogenase [Paenibacillus sp. 7124]|uniref:FAD/FMN-containing dehydrogenase n=1 Tax=Paenibacillus apii TaxID=1850370 RepID=A0A6M1PL44_9BACL|nr:FAD/FMN-containing dehydrogenase [Paenibacillus apii]NGM84179.1 FAD/FMN-containing dehydrogenase [Paenibacillus apii]NJJ38641.1 FAD/FMN-containing dehydrogenase [Paenibacillus apii]
MKKLWIGLSALVLVMGLGTAGAYAATANNDNNNSGFFEKMLPFAKQMHPNLSEKQIEEMYDNCSTSNGVGMSEMMQNSQFSKGMMNF